MRFGDRLRLVRVATWRARAELLLGGALLFGWGSLTVGIARLTSPTAWFFSAGLLLLSLCGWRLLWALAAKGLYALTRRADGPRA